MKILHIPNFYPPHTGGIEDVCYNLVTNIGVINQKVICFNDNKDTEINDCESVEVIRVGVRFKLSSQAVSFKYRSILRKTIKNFCPDIIHFHAPNPLVAFYLLTIISSNTKLIVHWHSDIVEQKVFYFLIKPIEQMLLKRATKIIVTSPLYLSKSKALAPYKSKVEVVLNIITESKIQRKETDEEQIAKINLQYGRNIIFFVGRHVTYKGLGYLLEAEGSIKNDCTIVIAGHGPLTDQLKSKVKSKRVFFVGKVSDDELRYFFYASKIFAFPSITKNEAFGVALAEAMYCGLPAITFNIPGSGVNWVNRKGVTGIEVENRNSQAFGLAIDLLLSDHKLYNEMSDNAKLHIKNHLTIEKVIPKLQEIYAQLLNENK